MNLKSYIDLVELLEENPSSREENRAFGLTQVVLKNRPLAQISAWIDLHHKKLKRPLLSETFSSYLYSTTLTLVLLAFVLGSTAEQDQVLPILPFSTFLRNILPPSACAKLL